MTLTRNVAVAMAKGFAAYAVEYGSASAFVPTDPEHNKEEVFDCVVAEESDAYQSFVADMYYETFSTPRGQELDWDRIDADPMYQLFRKTLYAHALLLHKIREEMGRLDYDDDDVAAMFPDLEGQELLDMLIGAEPATEEEK